MVTRHIFSIDELQDFDMKQLRKLAKYYKIEFDKNTEKGTLMTEIYEAASYNEPSLSDGFHMEEVPDDGLPRMSARVRRIYELNKNRSD